MGQPCSVGSLAPGYEREHEPGVHCAGAQMGLQEIPSAGSSMLLLQVVYYCILHSSCFMSTQGSPEGSWATRWVHDTLHLCLLPGSKPLACSSCSLPILHLKGSSCACCVQQAATVFFLLTSNVAGAGEPGKAAAEAVRARAIQFAKESLRCLQGLPGLPFFVAIQITCVPDPSQSGIMSFLSFGARDSTPVNP